MGAADQIAAAVASSRSARRLDDEKPGAVPFVVAIDGPGASGKTTIAARLRRLVPASVVHTDDFFASLSAARRQALDPSAGVAPYYDLGRMASHALQPLRAGRSAAYEVFAWLPGTGGPVGARRRVRASEVVIVEGVASSCAELAPYLDLSVLVDTPEALRLRRLHRRISPEMWDDPWLEAERAYFSSMRPPSSFDLVVAGSLG